MPSPFPGMDPFLEDPMYWPDVHASLISAIRDELVTEMSPDFFVRIEERVYITHPTDDTGYAALIPEFTVVAGRPQPAQPSATPGVLIAPFIEVERIMEPEIHDRYLSVYDRRSHQVVTVIELLWPANKVKNSHGRAMLLDKRKALTNAGASYLEIDLLRGGERDEDLLGHSDYLVTLQRSGRHKLQVWYAGLRDPLPTVAVPLRPSYADVPLDLQRLLTETYDRARYADSVEYGSGPPPPALKTPDVLWVRRQLAEWQAQRGAGA